MSNAGQLAPRLSSPQDESTPVKDNSSTIKDKLTLVSKYFFITNVLYTPIVFCLINEPRNDVHNRFFLQSLRSTFNAKCKEKILHKARLHASS